MINAATLVDILNTIAQNGEADADSPVMILTPNNESFMVETVSPQRNAEGEPAIIILKVV